MWFRQKMNNDLRKIRLNEWANIAEIAGTAAVVISLIFVGVQINQNTVATRAAASQAVHGSFATWYANSQGDPALLSVSIKGMRDYKALNGSEKAQFIAHFMAFSLSTQDAYYKWREGSLDPELWRSWEFVSMNFFSTPGGRAFWDERGYLFAQSFQNFIENDLMKREAHPDALPWGSDVISQQGPSKAKLPANNEFRAAR